MAAMQVPAACRNGHTTCMTQESMQSRVHGSTLATLKCILLGSVVLGANATCSHQLPRLSLDIMVSWFLETVLLAPGDCYKLPQPITAQ